MFRSKLSKRLSMAGVALALAAGAQKAAAEESPVAIGLSQSLAVLSGQRAKSASAPARQLGMVSSRLESTRGLRVRGQNLNASSLSMRFSGGSAEKSAAFETRHLLAPEEARRTRRTAVWFGGDVTLDSARAEDPRLATIYTNGLTFGIDSRLGPRLLVGNAVGAAFDRTGFGGGGSLETRYLSNTLYGSLTTSRDTYLDMALGASHSAFSSHYGGVAPASRRTANQFFGQARYSHTVQRNRLRVRTYGQARVLRMHLDDYAEKGDGAHLCQPQSAASLEVKLGMRGETSMKTRVGKVSPHAVLEVSRTSKRTSAAIVTSMDDPTGDDHVTAPTATHSGRFTARTGLNWAITDRATVNGEYSVSSAVSDFNPQQRLTARFKLKF